MKKIIISILSSFFMIFIIGCSSGGNGGGGHGDIRRQEIIKWQKAEIQCENLKKFPFRKAGKWIGIKNMIKILNNNPPKWGRTSNRLQTSCEVNRIKKADCQGVTPWAYAKLRKIAKPSDKVLWIVWVDNPKISGREHVAIKIGNYAIDYWPGYWPKPYYSRPWNDWVKHGNYVVLHKFNLWK